MKEAALRAANDLIKKYQKRFPQAMEVLEEGLEDSLQFYSFQSFDFRKISSTNLLERLHKEIRRRSRVVGIFPGPNAYLRLVTCYLMEYADDWSSGKSYITREIIEEYRAKALIAA
ncbi:MAG: transposase [Syntrophales bacterium]|jgi:transposase-like protein